MTGYHRRLGLVVGLALVATACTVGETSSTATTEDLGPATTTTSAATTTTGSGQTTSTAGTTTVGSGVRPAAGGFATGLEHPTFGITLVVLEDGGDFIDQVVLVGAPEGELDPGCLLVLTDVLVSAGTFKLEFPDVSVEGEFVTPERAEGEIRGLTSAAQSCGFPETLEWGADCNQTVILEGDAFSTESGECGVVTG